MSNKRLSKHLMKITACALSIIILAGCASVTEFAVDPSASLENRMKSALTFGCTKVFSDLNETSNWYSNYGQTAVINARGLKKKTGFLLETDASSFNDGASNNEGLEKSISSFRRRYNEYLDEISIPLSGGKVAKCSDTEFCYELTYKNLEQQYSNLEGQLGVVRGFDANNIFKNPISVLYKHYVGSAKGQCKQSIISALSPEFNEVQALKYR